MNTTEAIELLKQLEGYHIRFCGQDHNQDCVRIIQDRKFTEEPVIVFDSGKRDGYGNAIGMRGLLRYIDRIEWDNADVVATYGGCQVTIIRKLHKIGEPNETTTT